MNIHQPTMTLPYPKFFRQISDLQRLAGRLRAALVKHPGEYQMALVHCKQAAFISRGTDAERLVFHGTVIGNGRAGLPADLVLTQQYDGEVPPTGAECIVIVTRAAFGWRLVDATPVGDVTHKQALRLIGRFSRSRNCPLAFRLVA